MSFGIANFDSLPYNVKLAFEDLEAWVAAFLLKEHNADGTHGAKDGTSTLLNSIEAEGHWWKKGPWRFDGTKGDTASAVCMRGADLTAGTYNDFTTQGLDDCIVLDIDPQGQAIVLTGIKARTGLHWRLMGLRNGDSPNGAGTITLKHQDSGSLEPYRFFLPAAKEVVLATNQVAWMLFNNDRPGWYLFTTPHQSGGLATMSGVQTATLSLTEAQIEALNTTPVQIVAAPGANKIVVPIMWHLVLTITTGYSTSPTWRVVYRDSTTQLTNTITPGWTVAGTKMEQDISRPASFTTTGGGFDPRNTAVDISLTANPTGAGAGTAFVALSYAIMDTA